MSVQDCPFCHTNWKNLKIVASSAGGNIAVVEPLNPVTEGHVIVIHANHAESVADKPGQAAGLMEYAAKYVRDREIEANIITSIGEAATQTVFHTHLHVVPRTEHDGLKLPWTGQKKKPAAPTPANPAGWGDPQRPVGAAVGAEPAGAGGGPNFSGWGGGDKPAAEPARVKNPQSWGSR
jgi:diadenosine tetraphosphate (Ap4A) HIT family hydrolase